MAPPFFMPGGKARDNTGYYYGGGGIAVVVLALIEVSPIKINPLGAITKAIGQAINQDVLEKISSLEDKEDKQKPEYTDVSV